MDMNFPHRRTRGTTWQISFLGDKAPDLSILLAVASARQAACPTARFLAAEAGGPEEEDIVQALAQVFAPRAIENLRTRSEEHTSELQSLMRISYAVFCLKKKNITTI